MKCRKLVILSALFFLFLSLVSAQDTILVERQDWNQLTMIYNSYLMLKQAFTESNQNLEKQIQESNIALDESLKREIELNLSLQNIANNEEKINEELQNLKQSTTSIQNLADSLKIPIESLSQYLTSIVNWNKALKIALPIVGGLAFVGGYYLGGIND